MWVRRSAAVIAEKFTTVGWGARGAGASGGGRGAAGSGAVAGAAAAAATGGTAGKSQATRSVHTGTRDARKATRLALVLYELHPLMESFLCTNFTTASRSSPGMVSSLLSPRRFLAGRSDLGLDELKGCCAERFGRGVLGFRQDGRLRRHDHPGVERGRPADDPQVLRVDGAELDERSDLSSSLDGRAMCVCVGTAPANVFL